MNVNLIGFGGMQCTNVCNLFSGWVDKFGWCRSWLTFSGTAPEQYDRYQFWLINQYIFIVHNSTIFWTILEKNKCDKCNLTIHPNFIGNHKCDHQNCPICKSPISPSQYWFHLRSHPGHENDSPPPPKASTFENRRNTNYSGYGNYQRK